MRMTQAEVDRLNSKPRKVSVSDCCDGLLLIHAAREGTQCYVCSICKKPSNFVRKYPKAAASEGCDDESELHAEIRAECRRRGWICLGGSMAHRTRRVEGEPDFLIVTEYLAVPNGILFIECKTKVGKLTPAQLAFHAHAQKLGHYIHIVRSFVEFLKLL